MPRILKKIGDGKEDVRKINENFDKLSLDITDRSGQWSSEASGNVSIVSGIGKTIEVNVTDVRNIYQTGLVPIIPRVDIYIDNDGDADYYWPGGDAIDDVSRSAITVSVLNGLSVYNQAENEKATYWITIGNYDGFTHTFYVHTSCFFVPAPDYGVAQRNI